ncbi:MAG: hypothetical protein ACI8XO_001468 [Verrucomicrobiales bacterium]|jgi:hypothetical protein
MKKRRGELADETLRAILEMEIPDTTNIRSALEKLPEGQS